MIREISPEDKPMIEAWIAAESSHPDNTFDWYNESGAKSVVYEDALGGVLVAKFTPCLRVDIDFNPDASSSRIGQALTRGLRETAEAARKQGFREFVFESLSDKLSAFCERLGYRKSPDWRKEI